MMNMKKATASSFFLLFLTLVSGIIRRPQVSTNDHQHHKYESLLRAMPKGARLLSDETCTLLVKMTEFQDHSHSQELDCYFPGSNTYATFDVIPKSLSLRFGDDKINSNSDVLYMDRGILSDNVLYIPDDAILMVAADTNGMADTLQAGTAPKIGKPNSTLNLTRTPIRIATPTPTPTLTT